MCIFETNDCIMGKNIKYIRNRKGLSRSAFSDRFGISCNMLFCLEHDTMRCIPVEALRKISDAYDIPVEWIVGEDLCKTQCGVSDIENQQ